jgi:hypothetical protein
LDVGPGLGCHHEGSAWAAVLAPSASPNARKEYLRSIFMFTLLIICEGRDCETLGVQANQFDSA